MGWFTRPWGWACPNSFDFDSVLSPSLSLFPEPCSSSSNQIVLSALPGGQKVWAQLYYGPDLTHPLARSNQEQYKGQSKIDCGGKFVQICLWLLLLLKERVVVLRQDPQWDEETLERRNGFLTGHLHIDSALTQGRYNTTGTLGQSITSLADKHRGFSSTNPTLCLPRASSHQENVTEQTIIKAEFGWNSNSKELKITLFWIWILLVIIWGAVMKK